MSISIIVSSIKTTRRMVTVMFNDACRDWHKAKNGLILPAGQWYAPSAVIYDAWYFMVLHAIAWYCMVLHDIA